MDDYIKKGLVEAYADAQGLNKISDLSNASTNPAGVVQIFVREFKPGVTKLTSKTLSSKNINLTRYLEIGQNFIGDSTSHPFKPGVYEDIIEVNGEIVIIEGRIQDDNLRTWYFRF